MRENTRAVAKTKPPRCATLLWVGLLATLLVAPQAQARCVPDEFGRKWLQRQEQAGGHTIERHVGKSNRQLVRRYNDHPRIAGASTYPDLGTARRHVVAALRANRKTFNKWARGVDVGAQRAVTYGARKRVGRGVHRPTRRPASRKDVRPFTRLIVVMKKTGRGRCLLLTSYPTP